MADPHLCYLSYEQRIAQEEYDQYLEDYSNWYDMFRGHIVVAIAAHTIQAWKLARENRQRTRHRALRDVPIGVSRRRVRLFTPRSRWMDDSVAERAEKGEGLLLQDMRTDLRRFVWYTRMLPEQFDALHEMIKEDIAKENTNFRPAFPTEYKLGAVLR